MERSWAMFLGMRPENEKLLAQVKEMIERQQSEYNWQFTFLGANQDAFAEAAGIAINKCGAINYDVSKSPQAFAAAAANVGRMRASSASGQSIRNEYTDAERESAV